MLEIPSQDASPKTIRLGLALSGGGFRASFFHIGLLARMAELGLLKEVEVISTVSGGAIIGAFYYLHLKKLLETKTDSEISNQDYLEIIKKIEIDFLKAVQRNLIMTAYCDPFKTLKMNSSSYSSSLRLAELYESCFYRPILNPNSKDPIKMSDLKILPKGESAEFYPLEDNQKRQAKVPILLINAASLNTGRNWYFEATHMGEHSRDNSAWQEIDKNLRLIKPTSYKNLSAKHQDFLLSHAVAASAALPGVFAPIKISDLYPSEIDLQLVDGGVHDNQAIAGLLHFSCTDFIISDASRPLEFEAKPDIRSDGLLLRVRSILGDRLREEELHQMLTGKYQKHITIVHLRKNFPIPLEKPKTSSTTFKDQNQFLAPTSTQSDQTKIPIVVQQLLARIRTHLDSFTDLEAYSLMFYGYQIAQQAIAKTPSLQNFLKQPISEISWQFFIVKPWINNPTPEYLQQLKVGSERFLKIFRLMPFVRTISLTIGFLIFILILCSVFYLLHTIYYLQQVQKLLAISLNQAIISSSQIIGILFLGRIIFAKKYSQLRQSWFRFWSRALLPALCFPLVWLHLLYYDRLFLELGQLSRLKKPSSNSSSVNFVPDLSVTNSSDQPLEGNK